MGILVCLHGLACYSSSFRLHGPYGVGICDRAQSETDYTPLNECLANYIMSQW